MSVRAIAGASRTNSLSYRAQSTASSLLPVKAKAVSGAFGELLSQITGTAGTSDSDREDAEENVSVTKLLPGGSLVLMKRQEAREISKTTKLSGASVQPQNIPAAANTFTQAYSAGDALSSGSLFSVTI